MLDINNFQMNKSCEWAARVDTNNRCFTYPQVTENCPITCEVLCKSDNPTASPTTSFPTISSFPSLSPSSSPTEQILCEDKVDSTERFHVPGTAATEMRTCEWAGRMDNTFRCLTEVVRRSCPATCDTPCKEVAKESEDVEDDDDTTSFGQLNTGAEMPKEKSFPYTAVFASMGAIGSLGLLAYLTQKRGKAKAKAVEQRNLNPLEIDKTDDAVNEGYTSSFCGWVSGAQQSPHKITYVTGKTEV